MRCGPRSAAQQTGALVVSNLLAKQARRKGLQVNVRLIGNSPLHTYQPGSLFLPFRKPGYRALADIQRKNSDFVGPGVEHLHQTITAIEPEARTVTTDKGSHGCDRLAPGRRTVLDEIDGLVGRRGTRAHGFQTFDSVVFARAPG